MALAIPAQPEWRFPRITMKSEISIEFFPPQTPEGVEKLRVVREKLAVLKPEFFSVTFGAGGSTRERTFSIVKEIAAEGHQAAPHLSCVGDSKDELRSLLSALQRRKGFLILSFTDDILQVQQLPMQPISRPVRCLIRPVSPDRPNLLPTY